MSDPLHIHFTTHAIQRFQQRFVDDLNFEEARAILARESKSAKPSGRRTGRGGRIYVCRHIEAELVVVRGDRGELLCITVHAHKDSPEAVQFEKEMEARRLAEQSAKARQVRLRGEGGIWEKRSRSVERGRRKRRAEKA